MSVANTLHEAPVRKVERVEPAEFYREIAVQVEGGVQGIVTAGPSGAPNYHSWNKKCAEPGEWMAQAAKDRKPAYLTMAAFRPEAVQPFKGRSGGNVLALGGYWIDVEGSEEKGGYAGADAVGRAVAAFVKKTGLGPNFIVATGSGGMHLHYTLSEPVTVEQWKPGAEALVRLAAGAGFRIDAQCTTDAARIMRAPGSIHQKTGKVVTAVRCRLERYELAEIHKLVGCEPGSVSDLGCDLRAVAPRASTGINSDVLGDDDTAPADFELIRADCEAVRWAAEPANHARVSEPYWRGLLGIVKFCAGADELAHDVSKHHPKYDPDVTGHKLEGWTAGPTTCEYFADVNADACGRCKHAQGGQV